MRALTSALLGSLLIFVGCSSERKTSEDGRDAVAIQLNWYPEAEHGGVYQASLGGVYEAQGLDVEIRPGGRSIKKSVELALGRCQFAIANADDVVLARNQDLDIVAVMAAMQNHPRCILVQAASGVTNFEDLAGMTLQRSEGRAYVEFLRFKGFLRNVKEVPYPASIAAMLADPKIAVQGYSIAEPLLAKQQGVDVNILMVSDLGMNPYSSVLVTTGKIIREQPSLVQKMVDATRQGWRDYVDDPAKANQAILEANQHGMTAEVLEFGAAELVKLALPDTMPEHELGAMSADRWQTLVTQLEDIGIVRAGKVKADSCFDLQFLKTAESKSQIDQ